MLVDRPDDADRLLVVLHGHDDPPQRLPLALRARLAGGRWALAAPEGPTRTATGGPAWFPSAPGDEGPGIGDALDALGEGVERARAELGLPPEAVTVLGWSQGAAAALAWAARRTAGASTFRPLDVVGLAAWMPDAADLTWDLAAAGTRGLRATLVHGVDDEVVPLPLGRSAARLLDRHGVGVEWRQVACGHELVPLLEAAWEPRDRAR